MLYQLNDSESEESLGLVSVIQADKLIDAKEEIEESWEEFNKLEEHDEDLDHQNVDDFVEWHNRNRVTQIARVFLEIIQP